MKAHIYPKPLYDDVLGKNRAAFRISTDPLERFGRSRDGVYDSTILCAECDNGEPLNTYDAYGAEVFRRRIPLRIAEFPEGYRIEGYNYCRFKLFLISLLWRAGISSRPEFEDVRLGPHESRMREMILSGDPGDPHEYPCLCFSMELNEVGRGAIQYFESVRLGEFRCYRTMFDGKMWAYLVSRRTVRFPYPAVFLQRDGSLLIPKAKEFALEYIGRFAKEIRRHPDSERFQT